MRSGTRSGAEVRTSEAKYKRDCPAVPLDYCALYSGRMDMPWNLMPTIHLMPDGWVRATVGYSAIVFAFCLGIAFVDIIYSVYNDPKWNINYFFNFRCAQFGLTAVAFLAYLYHSWRFSSERFGGFPKGPSDMTKEQLRVVRRSKAWYFLNENLQLWFGMMALYGLLFGQGMVIWRAQNSDSTSPVRWMSGDNGALAVTSEMFYTTMGTSSYVIYEVFNVMEWVLITFFSYKYGHLIIWVENNDPGHRRRFIETIGLLESEGERA